MKMKLQNKRIITLYEDFNRDSEKFINIFKKEGKKIVYLLNNKIQVSNSQNNHIVRAYHYIIERETKEFYQYKKKLVYEKKINEKKFILEENYQELIKTYILLKKYMLDQNDKSTSDMINSFNEISKKFDKINKIIIVDLNSELNKYFLSLNSIKNYLSEILVILSTQIQIMLSNNKFKLKIENFSTLKKLDVNNLKVGDIILYQFNKKNINLKSINSIINSTILYSSIVYANSDGCLIYQNSNKNILSSGINLFEPKKDIQYIILRPKKKLSDIDRINIQNLLKLSITTEYSLLKLYGIALHYTLIRIYKTIFSFIGNNKGKVISKGIFSSQIIARVYEALEIDLTDTQHYGIVTPSELLNSNELKIVGYIEKNS